MSRRLGRRLCTPTERHIRLAIENKVPYEVFSFQEVIDFFNGRCAYTGDRFDKNNRASRDHVIPFSKGGGYVRSNILPCSISINNRKGDVDFWEWYPNSIWYDEKRMRRIIRWLEKTGGYIPDEYK